MPMNPTSFIPQEMKTSIIKIFTYKEKKATGVIINPYYEKIMYFDNIIQFLMIMDEMQDSLNYPQESMESRAFVDHSSFRYTPMETPSQEELMNTQPIATFKISIFFRQNAGWQGNIAWLDQATEAQFRSVLELIKLMDSVLSLNK